MATQTNLFTEIKTANISDSNYPNLLKTIHNPPEIIYYLGSNIERLNQIPCIAVVGSRNADRSGIDIANSFGASLCAAGACVVSGLALGIDAAAHAGALTAGGLLPTVAILGNGLPALLPKTNQRIGEEVLRNNGLIISQFAPGAPPFPQNFLDRNRVIAGLSAAVVVVQAGERSGALATARYALEQGREVYAVPGSPGDPRSAGTNKLIQEGAYLVTNGAELIEQLPGYCKLSKPDSKEDDHELILEEDQAELFSLIKTERRIHIDQIHRKFPNLSVEALLFELELADLIQRLPGNFISIV